MVGNVLAADVRGSEEGSRKGWMQSSITNVKAMMSRVAEQVSQVALFHSHSFSLSLTHIIPRMQWTSKYHLFILSQSRCMKLAQKGKTP